jgi:hypothetical protein
MAQVRALPLTSRRAPKRNAIAALTCGNAIEAQVSIEGGSPRTWETLPSARQDDTDVVVIDGSWRLPARDR